MAPSAANYIFSTCALLILLSQKVEAQSFTQIDLFEDLQKEAILADQEHNLYSIDLRDVRLNQEDYLVIKS